MAAPRMPELLAAARGERLPATQSPRFAHIDENWARVDRPERPMVSVSHDGIRLLIGAAAGAGQLFDLTSDPREQNDVSAERPETVARLRELARSYLSSPPAPWGAAPEVGLDEAELRQLRALGYSVEN